MAHGRADAAMSGEKKSKKRKKRMKEMRIRKAKSGGYIVNHDYMPDEEGMPSAEEHVMADDETLKNHVCENCPHMGDEDEEEMLNVSEEIPGGV